MKQASRKVAVGVLCACCALVSTQGIAAVDRAKSQIYFEDAVDSLRLGQSNTAIIHLRNALQQDPNNLAARIQLGELLLADGSPLAAINELEMALSLGGDENLILVSLANAYMDVAKPERVIAGISSDGHRAEVDSKLKVLQGNAYLQLGSKKEAESLFLAASSLTPSAPSPLLGLAQIAIKSGKLEKANQLIEQANALSPGNFEVLLFKALVNRDHTQYPVAIAAFEEALTLKPKSVRALTGRAAMWIDLGKIDQAKEDLEIVTNSGSNTLESLYLRAMILFGEGKTEEAREVLRSGADDIREIEDSYRAKIPNTTLMLGIVAFLEENYDEAISHLTRYLAKIPTHPGAKRYLSAAYLANQEWPSIIKLLTPKSGRRLNDPFALSILAEAHRAQGEYRDADRYYHAAVSIAPDIASLGIRMAENRLDAGRPDKAIEELEGLLEKHPQLMDIYAQLARVYLKTGAKQKAKHYVNELLDKFPDDARGRVVASGVFLKLGNLKEARLQLEQASLLDPEAIVPRLNLARLARIEGHFESAEVQYRSVLENFPGARTPQFELIKLLIPRGEFEDAESRLNELSKTWPNDKEVIGLTIDLLMAREKNVDKIRAALFDYGQAFPKDADVDLTVGRGYLAIGDLDDAKIKFRHAVENAEFNAEILYQAANFQYKISDLSGALWSLTKASQASPDELKVLVLQAAVLTRLDDLDRARSIIDKAIDRHGAQAEIFLVEGDFFMKQSLFQEAIGSYERAQELRPARKTTDALFRAYIKVGRYDLAEPFIKSWIDKYPQDLKARQNYAEMLSHQERWNDAKLIWENLQKDGIENLQVLNNLAIVYQRLQDPRALLTAKLVYEKAPESAAILDTYGWVLTQNGKVEEGLAILREAYARASTHPEIRFHIGQALANLGRSEEAREEIEAALESDMAFADKENAQTLLKNLEN